MKKYGLALLLLCPLMGQASVIHFDAGYQIYAYPPYDGGSPAFELGLKFQYDTDTRVFSKWQAYQDGAYLAGQVNGDSITWNPYFKSWYGSTEVALDNGWSLNIWQISLDEIIPGDSHGSLLNGGWSHSMMIVNGTGSEYAFEGGENRAIVMSVFEPATLGLLGLGLVAIGLSRLKGRARRDRSQP